jgi:hypothetical protein
VGRRAGLILLALMGGCGGGASPGGGHDAGRDADAARGDAAPDRAATSDAPPRPDADGAPASSPDSAPEAPLDDAADGPAASDAAAPPDGSPSETGDAVTEAGREGGAAPCPGPLVGLYHFEETTGPVVDSSGCGHDGVASAGVARGASGVGKAASFSPPAAVTVAGIDASLLDGDFTFEAWVYREAGTGGAVVSLVGAGAPEGVWVWSDADGKVTVTTGDDACTGTRDWGTATVKLAGGGWSHVAVDMLRGSPGGLRYFHIYIDGTFALAAAGVQQALCHQAGAALYIGAVGAGTSLPWTGRIDEVKVWATSRDRSAVCADVGGVYGASCDVTAVRPQ